MCKNDFLIIIILIVLIYYVMDIGTIYYSLPGQAAFFPSHIATIFQNYQISINIVNTYLYADI